MKFETGVHRVQRIPLTETMGRIHTSTMTVAVLPQPEEVGTSKNLTDCLNSGQIHKLTIFDTK